MGVIKYESRGRLFWQVDETLVMLDGREVRLRKRRIPTKEQAVALVAKARANAFRGALFRAPREAEAHRCRGMGSLRAHQQAGQRQLAD